MPKPSPVAEPTPRKTPKPLFALNVPSPRNAKLRASPEISTGPIFTFAPTDWNETSSCVALAPVSSLKSRAVSVTNVESLTSSVSTWNWNESTLPFANVSWRRIASSFVVPSALRSSAVVAVGDRDRERAAREELRAARRDVDRAVEVDRPCRTVTEKFWTPIRMSSNSRTLPSRIFPSPAVAVAGRAVRRRHAADPELGDAEREAVAADDEARDDRRGALPGSVTLCPAFGSNGRMIPRTPNFGKTTFALLIADELLARSGPAGSYWIWMPSAVIVTTSGTVASRPGDAQAELARDVDAEVAAQQAERVDGDVERAEDAGQVDGDAALTAGCVVLPSASVARSRPIAIVRTTMPSLKPKSASPTVGPCRRSGPRLTTPVAVAAPGAAALSVNDCVRPAPLAFASGARRRPGVRAGAERRASSNAIVTAPGWKRSIAFCGFLSLRK